MITGVSQPVQPTVECNKKYSNQQKRRRFHSIDEIEAEFGIMITKIQEALEKKRVSVRNLVKKLRTSSAVRDREVPLFDPSIFEKVTSIDKLFETLSGYWHLFDYDVLVYLVNTAECEEAKVIYDNFLGSFDASVIHDYFGKLIHSSVVFNKESDVPGTCRLRVKITQNECTAETKDEVKDILSTCYRLEKYALICKGIKQGCIELTYQTSSSVKFYLLQYKITKYELSQLKAYMITALKIDDEVDLMNDSFVRPWKDRGLLYYYICNYNELAIIYLGLVCFLL